MDRCKLFLIIILSLLILSSCSSQSSGGLPLMGEVPEDSEPLQEDISYSWNTGSSDSEESESNIEEQDIQQEEQRPTPTKDTQSAPEINYSTISLNCRHELADIFTLLLSKESTSGIPQWDVKPSVNQYLEYENYGELVTVNDPKLYLRGIHPSGAVDLLFTVIVERTSDLVIGDETINIDYKDLFAGLLTVEGARIVKGELYCTEETMPYFEEEEEVEEEHDYEYEPEETQQTSNQDQSQLQQPSITTQPQQSVQSQPIQQQTQPVQQQIPTVLQQPQVTQPTIEVPGPELEEPEPELPPITSGLEWLP